MRQHNALAEKKGHREDTRDVIQGKEVITVHQWPCDATVAQSGGYRDIWRLGGRRLGASSWLM